jgi:hypothetical protein
VVTAAVFTNCRLVIFFFFIPIPLTNEIRKVTAPKASWKKSSEELFEHPGQSRCQPLPATDPSSGRLL